MSKQKMKLKLVERALEVLLAHIIIDQSAQAPGAGLVSEVVWDYTDLMIDGVELPPGVAFVERVQGGEDRYYLADGFHRVESARKAKKDTYRLDVYEGGLEEARLYASGANSHHGLHRTREDKHRAVTMALANPLTEGWSKREIADHCGVSHTFVNRIVKVKEAAEKARQENPPAPESGNVSTSAESKATGPTPEDLGANILPVGSLVRYTGPGIDGAYGPGDVGEVTDLRRLRRCTSWDYHYEVRFGAVGAPSYRIVGRLLERVEDAAPGDDALKHPRWGQRVKMAQDFWRGGELVLKAGRAGVVDGSYRSAPGEGVWVGLRLHDGAIVKDVPVCLFEGYEHAPRPEDLEAGPATPAPAYAFMLGQAVVTTRELSLGRASAFGPMRKLPKGAEVVVKARGVTAGGIHYEVTTVEDHEVVLVDERDLAPYEESAVDEGRVGHSLVPALRELVQAGEVDEAVAAVIGARLGHRRQRQILEGRSNTIAQAARRLTDMREIVVGDVVHSEGWKVGDSYGYGWGIVLKAPPTGHLQALLMPLMPSPRLRIEVGSCWLDQVSEVAEPDPEREAEAGQRVRVTWSGAGGPDTNTLGTVVMSPKARWLLVDLDEPVQHDHLTAGQFTLERGDVEFIDADQIDIEEVVPAVDCTVGEGSPPTSPGAWATLVAMREELAVLEDFCAIELRDWQARANERLIDPLEKAAINTHIGQALRQIDTVCNDARYRLLVALSEHPAPPGEEERRVVGQVIDELIQSRQAELGRLLKWRATHNAAEVSQAREVSP